MIFLQWAHCASLAHKAASTRVVLTWLPRANPVNVGMPRRHIHTTALLQNSQMVAWRMLRTTAVTLVTSIYYGHGVLRWHPPDGSTAPYKTLFVVSIGTSWEGLNATGYRLKYINICIWQDEIFTGNWASWGDFLVYVRTKTHSCVTVWKPPQLDCQPQQNM